MRRIENLVPGAFPGQPKHYDSKGPERLPRDFVRRLSRPVSGPVWDSRQCDAEGAGEISPPVGLQPQQNGRLRMRFVSFSRSSRPGILA